MTNSPSPRPWYMEHSVIIIAGCLIAIIGFGGRASMGMFNKPITDFHGWPRETFGFAMALQNLAWGIMQPVAGAFADRFGATRVLMVGALLYAAGLFLMPFSHTPGLIYMTGGVLVGSGIAVASFSIVMAAFGRLVPPEKRSWAFGIAVAAGSMGQFIFAPLGQAFIAAFGWQSALMLLAAILLFIIPLAIPLSAKADNSAAARAAAGETDLDLRQAIAKAFGHGSFVLLVLGFFVCGFQLAFVTIHMPPYLIEHGISTWLAAWSIAIVGVFNVVGSYVSGMIGGRYVKRYALSLIYLGRSIAVIAFITLPITPASTLIFTAVMGLLWLSTVPLTMGLVTVMFGTRYMATLYGFVFLSHQIGSFFGVWLGGLLHDIYGTYDPVWWMGVALGLFAALVHLPIREARAPAFTPQGAGA